MKLLFTILKKGRIVLSLLPLAFLNSSAYSDESIEQYLNMPFEELLSLEVTSVSKKKQPVNEVAAAVFIITQDDIKRSGVTSIPEALRMAPGIQVSRMDSNRWAITSRGFASQYTNKLLVMIDGRTVYTPSYSGVDWDAQDTLMEDIERIEVIRGPGATIWGANAVNGIINVITKKTNKTIGGIVVAGAGNEEKAFTSLRYGTELNETTDARVYFKYNKRDSSYAVKSYAPTLKDAGDDWKSIHGGFRLDSQISEKDKWIIQGDVYQVDTNQILNLSQDPSNPANAALAPFFLAENITDESNSSGWNILTKWEHNFSEYNQAHLQFYFDHTERSEIFVGQQHDTLDIDFQHQFKMLPNHDVIWGLGYRHIKDDFDNTFATSFEPSNRNIHLYSGFIQDEIILVPNTLRLTMGTKIEYNHYTDYEIQPSIRLVWLANKRNTLWTAISKAARTPSRMENSGKITTAVIPLPPTFDPFILSILGNEEFKSESLLSYEFGYRTQPQENLSFDLALFYHDYDDLQSFELVSPMAPISNQFFANKLTAHSYGLELSMDWYVKEWWRLQSNYSFINVSAKLDNDSTEPNITDLHSEGSSPKHQISIRSMMDLNNQISLDMWFYHVSQLKKTSLTLTGSVPAYNSFNIRVAWQPLKNLELSLVGQNLTDSHHPEFISEPFLTQSEVERSIYGQIRWSF